MNPPNIRINSNIESTISTFFEKNYYTKVGVLVDENTLLHCYPIIAAILPPHFLIEIKSGEQHKNINTCQKIWQTMTEQTLDRKALLLNLGGGVIGDMGGFCASTYKRGIDFIQIPTTLLSQVDASVGGKLGIDFQGFKNHIGVFREPTQVWISPVFLQTLPHRQWLSGFAEIIKHALIADANHWQILQNSVWEKIDWESFIAHSVGIKSAIVMEDFEEGGRRKILNFGHTLGHAIETFFLATENPLLHGEAVALGMVAESYIAWQKGLIDESLLEEIRSYIFGIFDLLPVPTENFEAIISLTLQDKKNTSSQVKGVLVKKAGQAIYDVAFSREEMWQALLFLQEKSLNY